MVVDALSTSNAPSIHAVGDVTNRVNLTPVAIREGHALADRLFGGGKGASTTATSPSAVFATPEIGAVGLTEAEAQRRFEAVDVYFANFKPMKATLGGGGERAIMKLVVDAGSGRVVGVHILAREAGEMIQIAAIAIKMGATKADFDATMARPSDRRRGAGDDARADAPRAARRDGRERSARRSITPPRPFGPLDQVARAGQLDPGEFDERAHPRRWRKSAWVSSHRSTSSSGMTRRRGRARTAVADETRQHRRAEAGGGHLRHGQHRIDGADLTARADLLVDPALGARRAPC